MFMLWHNYFLFYFQVVYYVPFPGPRKRGAQASLRAEHAFVGKRRNTPQAAAFKMKFWMRKLEENFDVGR